MAQRKCTINSLQFRSWLHLLFLISLFLSPVLARPAIPAGAAQSRKIPSRDNSVNSNEGGEGERPSNQRVRFQFRASSKSNGAPLAERMETAAKGFLRSKGITDQEAVVVETHSKKGRTNDQRGEEGLNQRSFVTVRQLVSYKGNDQLDVRSKEMIVDRQPDRPLDIKAVTGGSQIHIPNIVNGRTAELELGHQALTTDQGQPREEVLAAARSARMFKIPNIKKIRLIRRSPRTADQGQAGPEEVQEELVLRRKEGKAGQRDDERAWRVASNHPASPGTQEGA